MFPFLRRCSGWGACLIRLLLIVLRLACLVEVGLQHGEAERARLELVDEEVVDVLQLALLRLELLGEAVILRLQRRRLVLVPARRRAGF